MIPDYYMMTKDEDLFAWTRRLQFPMWMPARSMLQMVGIWITGFRYARRCLWKYESAALCAADARKAANCFMKLAELLENE